MIRCLKPNGKAFVQLQLGNDLDKYGVLHIEDSKDFLELISDKNVKVIKNEKNKILSAHNHALNWNIIFQKNNN